MSITCTTAYRKVIPKPPLEIDLLPLYGLGSFTDYNDATQVRSFMTAVHTDPQANPTISFPDVNDFTFLYYMAPVEYGLVTFKDSSGIQGGWDGASWPADDVGSEYGPVIITYQDRQWYMYRTDFPGNRAMVYTVSFANG
jgi:hypothetical protein